MIKLFIHLLITTLILSYATPLLKTGQTKSYNHSNEVLDGSIKDDGYYQVGATRSYFRIGNVVIDNVTGLQWQDNESVKKQWITDDSYSAGDYNNTSGDTATSYCSNLSLDGGGWRLPSVEELETIIDFSKANPSVTEGVFNFISSDYYWSSSTYIKDPLHAWNVRFSKGYSRNYYKYNERNVLCVRGEQLDDSSLSRSGESVSDSNTNLQWQDSEIVKTQSTYWLRAINYCEDLSLDGSNDWRLPNYIELLSIVDRALSSPSINSIFVNVGPSYEQTFWSSTSLSTVSSYGMIINFINGDSKFDDKNNHYHVRCVRGGQLDSSSDTSKINPSIIMYLLN